MTGKLDYRGRFAPSPTGDLHFGSLVTAMASYADARSNKGCWIIRIDDIDKPRVVKGSSQSILYSLESLGFAWDEEVYYQSKNIDDYKQIIIELYSNKLAYPCSCSRKQILAISPDGIYPSTCKEKNLNFNINTPSTTKNPALRLICNDQNIRCNDLIFGEYKDFPANKSGDFIVYRADQVTAYLLAFVADIYIDRINRVIRGADLLESTCKQIYLQQLLSYPVPEYAHIPVICNHKGIKLSKSCNARQVKNSIHTLILAAKILGQTLDKHIEDATIAEFWQQLINNWDLDKVPKLYKINTL